MARRLALADAIFICVGTPRSIPAKPTFLRSTMWPGRSRAAARSPKLVIEKSTVPAQTGEQLRRALQVYGRSNGAKFRVASNPEFLREGTAVGDFFHPERIVVGVEDAESEQQLREIYRPILEGHFHCPVHQPTCPAVDRLPRFLVTTIASAELIKHASNSFLGLKISYANIACRVMRTAGRKRRGSHAGHGSGSAHRSAISQCRFGVWRILPAQGYTGIFPSGRANGVDFGMLREVERVNKRRIDLFLEKVRRALWVLKDKEVGVLGLAFKPNTDDIRFAPGIEVCDDCSPRERRFARPIRWPLARWPAPD